MLGRGVHAVLLVGLGFQADHLGDVVHVIAVPGTDFHAVGVEGQVEADGALFLGVLGNHFVQQLFVMGDTERVVRHVHHAGPGVVAAVAAQHHRHAQAGGFRDFLERVVLVNQGIRGAVHVMQVGRYVVGDDGVVHRHVAVAVLVRIGGLVGVEPLFGIRIHGGEGAAGGGVPQQADLLIDGHLGQQVVHTGADFLAPVFVDIQDAVGVQVLEFQSVHLDDFLGAGFQADLAGGFVGLNDHFVHLIGFVEGRGVGQGCGRRRVEVLLFRHRGNNAYQRHDHSQDQ